MKTAVATAALVWLGVAALVAHTAPGQAWVKPAGEVRPNPDTTWSLPAPTAYAGSGVSRTTVAAAPPTHPARIRDVGPAESGREPLTPGPTSGRR